MGETENGKLESDLVRLDSEVKDTGEKIIDFRKRMAEMNKVSDDYFMVWTTELDKYTTDGLRKRDGARLAEPALPLGRQSTGSLRISDTSEGLWGEVDMPDTQYGRDLGVSIGRGDVRGASFAFRTLKDEISRQHGEIIRELVRIRVSELSVVTFPAYPQTKVEVMSGLGGRNWAFEDDYWASLAYSGCERRAKEYATTAADDGTPTPHQSGRAAVLEFVKACRKRYGSWRSTPRNTPAWNCERGWLPESKRRRTDWKSDYHLKKKRLQLLSKD